MRKWGWLVSFYYVLILLVLIVPGAVFIVDSETSQWPGFRETLQDTYTSRLAWILIAIVIAGQVLLLFLSVDTSQKRLKPRAHILVSAGITGLLVAFLALAALSSLAVGLQGDKAFDPLDKNPHSLAIVLGGCALLWFGWALVFYFFSRKSGDLISRAVAWLLRGSVLELLIAVPCHVIARRRNDCSAPVVTSFGIATGIAIMLLSFGPSILVLYKRRFDSYATPRSSGK